MAGKHVGVDIVAIAQNILTKALHAQREIAKAAGGEGKANWVEVGKGTFVYEGGKQKASPVQAIMSTLRSKGAAVPTFDQDWFKANEFPVTHGRFGQMLVAPKGLLAERKSTSRTSLAVDFTA